MEIGNLTPEEIEGARARIWPINWECITDPAEEVVKWVNDPEVKEALKFFSFFQEPLTHGCQIRYFSRMMESDNDQIFLIETKTGEFVGTCGLHDIDWFNDSSRLGIIIFNKNYWRKGYGKEVLNLLLHIAFERLGMNKVYLTARVDNKVAIHIYKKLGFKKEGIMKKEYKVKKGQYIDLLRMSILRSTWETRRFFDQLTD